MSFLILKLYSQIYFLWLLINFNLENEIEEIKEDNYFPNIIGTDRHEEENIGNAVEPVPHKLPNLSRKYRKALKDSGSDESDSQIKNIFNSAECSPENEAKGVPHIEYEFDKNDNYDMISNNVNRSRSMLNRFNQANNTTDSRVASKNNMLPSSIKKNSRIAKDDMSSTSPHGGLNMSGTHKKKVKIVSIFYVR